MIIKSVGVLSVGKILGCLYAALGLFAGCVFALISLVGGLAGGMRAGPMNALPLGVFFGVGAIFVMPVFYGIMGFIGGIISGALYNLVAAVAGGIEIELEQTEYRE